MIKDYRYLYNPQQAEFYIKQGLIPDEININRKTNKVYFKFRDSDKLQNIYKKWMLIRLGEKH